MQPRRRPPHRRRRSRRGASISARATRPSSPAMTSIATRKGTGSTASRSRPTARAGARSRSSTSARTQQVRAIVEGLPAGAPAGSVAQKVGDYYRSYLDTATIERLGLAPAQAGLDAIAAARSYADVATLMGRPDLGLRSPLRIGMAPDQKDPDRYMVILTQSGLGLPDRDYYLKDDAVYSKLRTQYVAHITRLLSLSGTTDAATQAQAILELETHIARLHWPAAKRRERDLTYNPRSTRGARAAGARLPLAGAVRRRRPRGAAALRGARTGRGAGAGAAVHHGAARHLARLPRLPLPGRALRRAAAGLRRRVFRVLRPHAARPAAAARALEARRGRARRRSGRGGRRAVRGSATSRRAPSSRCSSWSRTCAPPTPRASSS